MKFLKFEDRREHIIAEVGKGNVYETFLRNDLNYNWKI